MNIGGSCLGVYGSIEEGGMDGWICFGFGFRERCLGVLCAWGRGGEMWITNPLGCEESSSFEGAHRGLSS